MPSLAIELESVLKRAQAQFVHLKGFHCLGQCMKEAIDLASTRYVNPILLYPS